MTALTVLALASALVASAAGADVIVFNFGGVSEETSPALAWAPVGRLGEQRHHGLGIVGGRTAKKNEFPHQASMQVTIPGYEPQHLCGGTLIEVNWVLTAAHCVYGIPASATGVSVVLGINSLTKDKGQRLNVVQALVHSQYNTSLNVGPYDIALLKLDGRAKLNKGVKLALLPKADAVPTGKATLSGWGSTSEDGNNPVYPDRLQTLDFPIIDFQTCYNYVSSVTRDDNPLADTNLCVGDLTKTGLSSCSGDSGGPLVQKSGWFGGKTTVIGVVSWGLANCGSVPFPSVFTRVSAYISWIDTIMNNYK
ncbi:Elastase-1 [Frankliniella fusca]|uniref:Elastase-1 n=1 Tax=Frankliniella fusca TaxID=407009 RepID=A0AAE1LE83_9NEOP|nr:Elastase-1 [Frankliniella fusca]